MYDMCLSEGNNLTRTFDYIYKQGAYANVTVNYIFDIGNELNGTIFFNDFFPFCVVGEELVAGTVLPHIEVEGFEFNYVTYQEVITNAKGMLPGSNVHDENGFWVYDVTDAGNVDLNFIYSYKPINVDPTPEPTPTPAHGNDTDDNGTEPVDPTPASGNETDPIVPVNNKVVNDININNMGNITVEAVLNDSSVITMPVTGKNPLIAIVVLIVFILVFVVGYYVDNKGNED
jgi:hypothetical protein